MVDCIEAIYGRFENLIMEPCCRLLKTTANLSSTLLLAVLSITVVAKKKNQAARQKYYT